MKQTPPLSSYKPCWEEADGTTRERPPDKVSDPRGTGAGSPQTLTTAYAAVSVHAHANGGLWDWRQQSRGSPTTIPKRASEPLCHSRCLSCAPSKLVFHSFLQGAGTSEELEASCTVQPLHKVRTERGTARRFHFTLEKISLLSPSKWEEQPAPCLAKSSSHLGGAFSTLSKGWKSRSSLQYDLAFSSHPVAQVRLHPCLNGDALTHMRTHSFQKSPGTWWCCYNTGSPRTISLFSGLQHWHHGRCRHLAPAAGAPVLF